MNEKAMAELAAHVAELKAQLTPDMLFIVNAVETAERARWSVVASSMFKAEDDYGCGFYGDDEWLKHYSELKRMCDE